MINLSGSSGTHHIKTDLYIDPIWSIYKIHIGSYIDPICETTHYFCFEAILFFLGILGTFELPTLCPFLKDNSVWKVREKQQ